MLSASPIPSPDGQMLKQTIKLSIQSTSIIGRVGQLVIDLEEVGVDPPYVIPSVHGMRASKLR